MNILKIQPDTAFSTDCHETFTFIQRNCWNFHLPLFLSHARRLSAKIVTRSYLRK